MVLVLDPSAVRLLGVAVRDIALTTPGRKLTVVFPFTPLQVAVTVAEPTIVGLVNKVVAVPFDVIEL